MTFQTCRHTFTELAPETNLEPCDRDDARMWKWCIRCGTLRLGSELFRPGSHQKKVVVADEQSRGKGGRHAGV